MQWLELTVDSDSRGIDLLEAELTLVNPMTKPAEEKQHALSAFCRKLAE